MDRTLKCDPLLESCSAVLYCSAVQFVIFEIYQFGLDTVRSERVKNYWLPFRESAGSVCVLLKASTLTLL